MEDIKKKIGRMQQKLRPSVGSCCPDNKDWVEFLYQPQMNEWTNEWVNELMKEWKIDRLMIEIYIFI
jgi:hypothetical protein